MDYCGRTSRIFANNAGGGDERFLLEGPERMQIVLDAVQEGLDFEARSAGLEGVV